MDSLGTIRLGTAYQRLESNRTIFENVARRYGFCPCLLAAICWHESSGIVQAVNPDSGAAGLMQIAPVHFQSLGWQPPVTVNRATRIGTGGSGWNDAGKNVEAGGQVLREFLNRTGKIDRALQYYVGASTMDRARTYIDNVLNTAIKLAGYYFIAGRWSD